MAEAAARSVTGSRWVAKEVDGGEVGRLCEGLGVSAVTARVLAGRGLSEVGAARAFLGADLSGLADPSLMPEMERAVGVVQAALESGARIRIYGDYDVDGVCATALVVRALRGLSGQRAGAGQEGSFDSATCDPAQSKSSPTEQVDWYIPHRVDEGYGVNEEAVRQAHADGVGLLITVDCGSTAVAQVALARELGMEVVVTDHHRLGEVLPDCAVLNPWRADSAYPFKELAGVGVAFKMVTALARARGIPDDRALNFLDLVCLGTVADVVPLVGENRLFVQHGLGRLARSRKVGISALMEEAGVGGRASPRACPTVREVAFGLAPRINAAGRMEDARGAVRLLLTREEGEARELARQLCAQNEARRAEELRTVQEAEEEVARSVNLSREKVIVLASERWHAGVIGIVASRLVERYRRPVLLVALDSGIGKGSGRSIGAFDLWEGLHACADLLSRFGGHRYAAGFGIEGERIGELRERLNEVADRRLSMDDLCRQIEVDAEVRLSDLTAETVEELDRLEPFGMGNPAPVLVLRELRLEEVRRVGDGSHVSLRFRGAGGAAVRGIWFRAGEVGEQLAVGMSVEVCFRPKLDEWGGARRVQLQVSDIGIGDGG